MLNLMAVRWNYFLFPGAEICCHAACRASVTLLSLFPLSFPEDFP